MSSYVTYVLICVVLCCCQLHLRWLHTQHNKSINLVCLCMSPHNEVLSRSLARARALSLSLSMKGGGGGGRGRGRRG